MSESPAPLVADRILHSRYRLVQPIARGGMAEVWEGRDEVLARSVAIKVLHRHLASDAPFLERFRREAIAAARLAHANVVATYDAATEDQEAFIVMELVRGRSLRHALTEDGPMGVPRAVDIAIQVAAALGHAHANGIIHRDVKPGNILLCEDDDGGVQAKVADFGIAKAAALAGAGPDLTATGGIIGTAKYLSPEQVEGQEPDARSDIYALGVTLYEMVCGRPPFVGDTELTTALAHVRSQALPPRRIRPGIPRPLELAILHAMARNPAERPPTVAHFRAELAAIDLSPDDATSMLSPDPTPTGPITGLPSNGYGNENRSATGRNTSTSGNGSSVVVAPAPGPTAARRPEARRSRAPYVVLAVIALAGAVLAGVLLSAKDDTPGGGGGRAAPEAKPVTTRITGAAAFDPLGDGREHDEEAPLAIDGEPTTAWQSQSYNGRRFGGLKDGVGLVFTLEGQARLRQLTVTSPNNGWSAQVFVAKEPGAALGDWGTAVAESQGLGAEASFDLSGHVGGAVLLWITDPGGNQAQITDVTLS